MKKIIEFMKRERMYVLLLTFVLMVSVLTLFYGEPKEKKGAGHEKAKEQTAAVSKAERAKRFDEEMALRRTDTEKLLRANPTLAALFSLASLLIVALFLLGLAVDAMLVSMRLDKKKLEISTQALRPIRWNLMDVARVVILFLFFGYVIVIIESALMNYVPLFKSENMRMILNTSILDLLAVVLIIYFTVGQYKEPLVSLGISVKNFARNVFYGIVGYVAALPVLVGTLALIVVAINITKYMPEKQPIVELFLKEKDTTFLMYSSLFAAVVGPIIEELFFRGFMYSALKKYVGIFWATALTASIFAMLHSNLAGFLPIMVLGIVLAYLYEKTGTLVSSMTLHIVHNLGMVFLVFLVKQMGMA